MEIGSFKINQFKDQDSFFDNYQEYSLVKTKNELKVYFEAIDQKIFNSLWRKESGYIPDGFKSRTLLTIYGKVTYKRRLYKYWNKTKYSYVFLADKELQIERYSRITSHFKFKILEQIATGKRQRDICDMFMLTKITRATVSNIIKSCNFQTSLNYFSKNITRIKIPECLYINMDETFIRLWKNKKIHKYRIRLVTFHTGYDKSYLLKKRKLLKNKRVYFQLLPMSKKINTDKFMLNLVRFAQQFYSNIENVKIFIYGDGAAWIRKAEKYWPNSNYVLDKFHAFRYLKQAFTIENDEFNWQNYKISKFLFELGAYNDLIAKLKAIKAKPGAEEKLHRIIGYFSNNALGVSNQNLQYNIGASAESDVSHIVKWLLGYGSKAFNYKTFGNMLFLKVAEINQMNVISFFKKQYKLKKAAERDYYWNNFLSNKKVIKLSLMI